MGKKEKIIRILCQLFSPALHDTQTYVLPVRVQKDALLPVLLAYLTCAKRFISNKFGLFGVAGGICATDPPTVSRCGGGGGRLLDNAARATVSRIAGKTCFAIPLAWSVSGYTSIVHFKHLLQYCAFIVQNCVLNLRCLLAYKTNILTHGRHIPGNITIN